MATTLGGQLIAQDLQRCYWQQGQSMQEMADRLGCSLHKIAYWMDKYDIARRSRSDATYIKHNPSGDPFTMRPIRTKAQAELLGMGVGLYWGEGTKADKYAVRLGNTDGRLLIMFMKFLVDLFGVNKDDMRFGLQIFTDIDVDEAFKYWVAELGVKRSQFYKVHITTSGSLGTYRRKSQHGVVTVYYHNKKLRDILVEMLPT